MYEKMTAGVVDTILNRVASPSFPNTVKDVVNQNRQFSKIAGPKNLKPYGSVEKTPKASSSFQSKISSYIQKRASGMPSSVGGNLHYANPNHSTKNNLGWINKLEGPKFGEGKSVHYHGTTSGHNPVNDLNISLDDSVQQLAYNDQGLPDVAPIPDGLFASVLNDVPKSNGLGLANLVDGNRNKSAVQYANQQATRNQRISPGLQAVIDQSAAAASEKHGVKITPVISSGGQFSKTDLKSGGFKGGRVGSTRHDHGLAGDMQFKANGKLLDMRNSSDRTILGSIVEESAARGVTGVGGAPNYMGTKTLHLGYGKPATWGKSGQPASKFVSDAYSRGRAKYDPSTPLYVDVPTPQPRYSSSTNAAPRGTVQREELGPASITPAPSGSVTRAGSLPRAKPQEATNPTARKLQVAYQKNNVPTPVARPTNIPKPTYTPKAADYSNYMMNVKQPTLPTGSAIPTPAIRPADLTPAPVIDGPAGKPLELVPEKPTRIQQAKTKVTDHLKEQLHPKTLAARGAGALIGGLLLGPMGAKAGQMFGPEIAKRMNNRNGGLFGLFNNQNNQAPMQTGAQMGSSSSQWGSAQNQGATYSASDGATITGLGNGTYSRTNPITGKSSQWNADGSRSTKGY